MRLERVIGSSVPRTAAQANVAPNLLTHAVIWRSKSQDAKLFTPTLTAPYAPSLPGTGYGRGRGYATSQITNKRHPGAENGPARVQACRSAQKEGAFPQPTRATGIRILAPGCCFSSNHLHRSRILDRAHAQSPSPPKRASPPCHITEHTASPGPDSAVHLA